MIKYIVFWTVISFVPDNTYIVLAFNHPTAYKNRVEENKMRIFNNRDSAFHFYRNAPQGATIDSIKIK